MSTLLFGSRAVAGDRALVMAIVNRTRDSFYDRGATFGEREALAAVDRVVAEGADIVDVGGVRAGADPHTSWPVLMALSNKDFIGESFGADLTDRVDGTLAATSVAVMAGARVFRAHEVARTRKVVEMVASIRGTRPPTRCLRALA